MGMNDTVTPRTPRTPRTPALYETRIQHVRTTPLRHAFRNRSYWWYVDVDHLPVLPRPLRALARFEARDHLGEPDRTIRENVASLAAEHGIDLTGGRVTMLCNARVLGHVFNPLSVFWCQDAAGRLACVIAEVHNTYGGRHAYLVETDTAGRARLDKRFYVSPFNPVEGHYTMRLPEPGSELDLAVTLHRRDHKPFVATVRGRRRTATTRDVLAVNLKNPAETLRVALRIRLQGIALWAKRLPVVARTPQDTMVTTSADLQAAAPTHDSKEANVA